MPTDLTPTNPRCEYLTNPLGIDVARPRLSWTLDATRRGQRQTAFQIIVAGSEERLRRGEGDLWDSGKVAAARSILVVYDGSALGSGQRCWWTVRVWDRDGAVSLYGPPAWWEMGLLHPDDWRGTWIGLDRGSDRSRSPRSPRQGMLRDVTDLDLAPSPYLRHAFDLVRPVRRARLYATARGLYEPRVNGQRVGEAVLAPGWTDYAKRIQYQTYDVGDLLRPGENVLGAILGDGWYAGHLGWFGQNRHYGPDPLLLLQLVVEHDDGSTLTVASDGAWRATTGPIRFSDLLVGESYDARAELPGWDAPGYDAAAWTPVRSQPRDETPLVADRAEPVRVTEEVVPVAITQPNDEATVVDLGQNLAGWVRLRVSGAAGTTVRLRFGEALNPDGTLYTDNLRGAHQTDSYVLAGVGDEVYEPRFTFHGFRYVEVSGYPGPLAPEAITGRVVESATPPAGEFDCSHPLVNRLHRAIAWGQRGNFLSVPTDCPQRDERLGWLADAQVFAPTACFNRDVAAFFTKWLIDVADAQSAEGAFPDIAPRLIDEADGAPAWGNGGVVLPWTLYLVYGDTRLLETHYEGMTRWLAYLEAANPDGLWTNRRGNDFGDWLAVGPATPKELLATAYFAQDARLLGRIARVLGRAADAERHDALVARIKTAFVAAYVRPDGRIAGETQTAYALALAFDLLPADLRSAAAAHLVEAIARRGWHLATGFVGVPLLLPVLTEAGYPDVAYRLLLNETFPSWGFMLRHGATTIWERWDGWTPKRGFQDPGMNSFNHYSLGSVGEWLYRSVAGIDLDPDRPGYEHVVIRPRPGGSLTHAGAEYRSIRGPISSRWRIDGDRFLLDVAIPANTTATVHVPTADPAAVTEGGRPATEADEVALLRAGDGEAVYAVGSGRFAFASPWGVG